MLVVSDTSPLRALSALGLFPVLVEMYGEVIVPPSVARELSVQVPGLPTLDAARLSGMRIQPTRHNHRMNELREHLDEGESEAIALALDIHADALLIDEAKGRRIALGLGLRVIGVVGVLVEAKRRGHIQRVGPMLDALERTIAFRISAELRAHAIRIAGE